MSASDKFSSYLEAQRAAYRRSLPARLASIRRHWPATGAAPALERDFEALEREAHSIAGSSGTLGLPAVGDAGRALELAVLSRDEAAIGAAIATLAARISDAQL